MQLKDLAVFWHKASMWQSSEPSAHSSTSAHPMGKRSRSRSRFLNECFHANELVRTGFKPKAVGTLHSAAFEIVRERSDQRQHNWRISLQCAFRSEFSWMYSVCRVLFPVNSLFLVNTQESLWIWGTMCAPETGVTLTFQCATRCAPWPRGRLARFHRATVTDYAGDCSSFTKRLFASEGTTSCLVRWNFVWDPPLWQSAPLYIMATVHIVAFEKYATLGHARQKKPRTAALQ